MKVFVVLMAVCAVSFAGESQFFTNQKFSQLQNADLETVNAQVMERLRQEAGAERGLYHVYLPDGRLQRVQYTAAPVRPAVEQQEATQDYRSSGPSSQNVDYPRNFYYVEVPAERLQALRASSQARYYQAEQQNYQQQAAYQQQQTAYTKQQNAKSAAYSQPLEVEAKFAPLQVISVDELAQQYRAEHPN